jgi:CDP-2,3-bis-(O-geranylgeranyl)-sn-glycerol synthase
VLRSRFAQPVDFGVRLADERPLFGTSKTWRGLAAALIASALCGPLLGYSVGFSLVFAALAMLGDLVSSFLKRRRGLAPSDQCLGLDQLPEAILPCAFAVPAAGLPWWSLILLPLVFMALELLVSRPLYRLRIRKRPY